MQCKWILITTLCGLWAHPLVADQVTINEQGAASGTLPFKVTPGNLVLCEGGLNKDKTGCQVGVSDLILFTQTNIGGVIRSQWTMFSDKESAADKGAMSPPGVEVDLSKVSLVKGKTVFIAEPVSEDGTETVGFTPMPTEPGFALEGGPAAYSITSDAPSVPEPSTMLLLGSGLLALEGMLRRHPRKGRAV